MLSLEAIVSAIGVEPYYRDPDGDGVEISEEYCKIARHRLQNLQPELQFTEAK